MSNVFIFYLFYILDVETTSHSVVLVFLAVSGGENSYKEMRNEDYYIHHITLYILHYIRLLHTLRDII